MTCIIMFFAALPLLVAGYPVVFTFGAVALLFGTIAVYVELMPDPGMVMVAQEFRIRTGSNKTIPFNRRYLKSIKKKLLL